MAIPHEAQQTERDKDPVLLLMRHIPTLSSRDARNAPKCQSSTARSSQRSSWMFGSFSRLYRILHGAGFELVPRTLEIGDFVLHDNLCVERKATRISSPP